LLLGLSIIQILINQISRYRYTRMAGRIVLDLRMTLFRHLERLPLDFYAERRAGDIASRIGGDIGEVQNAATGTVLSLATASLSLVATAAVLVYLDVRLLVYLDVRLLVISLVLVPVSFGIARRFAPPIRDAAREVREENANLASTLFDSILGQHFIRSHGLETRAAREFARDGRGILRSVLRLTRLNCFSSASNGLLTALSALVVLGYGGYRVIEGEMTLGSLMAFQIYVSRLHGPVQNLVSLYLRLQRSRVSIGRIREILALPTPPRGGTLSADDIRGDLRFENVSFAHTPGRSILENVSFSVSRGERVAIVGESGIGKSTLLDLAIGLREPDSGTITLDDRPLSD
jgi:ABC-type bacteriocin/lantibiotic exporter with double-glycine peptidase domain